MTDVLSDNLDEYRSAFVDPWSHQPQNWGDVPDHALFAGPWHLNLGIDTIHEALFITRDDHVDRLWSLTTSTDNSTRQSLAARERGDRAWNKRKISCGCVAGAVRAGSLRDAASVLMSRLLRARVHFAGSEPPYMPGLLTSDEMAGIVDALEQEIRRNTVAAEADQQRDEAAVITAARDLKLNPRPVGHNSTAWIADCARRKHFIEISTSRNEFFCGYCRRSGGPAELEAFCVEAV